MEKTAPRLLIPALRPFYNLVEPLSWALVRITVGLMIIPHGWPKLMMGIEATANMALVKRGIGPAPAPAQRAPLQGGRRPPGAARHSAHHARDARRPVRRARPLHALLGGGHRHRDDGHRLPPPAEI